MGEAMGVLAELKALGTPCRSPRGIDQGRCLVYWLLSFRRRLIRDLWFAPIGLALGIGLVFASHASRFWVVGLLLSQLAIPYNYFKWQRLEK